MTIVRYSLVVITILVAGLACTGTRTPLPWPFNEFEGEWFSEVRIDPLTDEQIIVVAILARDSQFSDGSWLFVRCDFSEGTEQARAGVMFDKELEGGFLTEVQYRFDEGPVETNQWYLNDEFEGNDILFSSMPGKFVRQIMGSSVVALREEGGENLVFDVEGLSTALHPYRSKCNWLQPESSSTESDKVTATPTTLPRPTQTPSPTATLIPTATPLPIATAHSTIVPTATPRIQGVPEPEEWDGSEGIATTESNAVMIAYGSDGLSGSIHLIQVGRKTRVTVTLHDADPGPYSAAIRRGSCSNPGQLDYLLFDVIDGASISMVDTPAAFFQFSLSYVVVVGGTDLENDPMVSCGNIPSPLR